MSKRANNVIDLIFRWPISGVEEAIQVYEKNIYIGTYPPTKTMKRLFNGGTKIKCKCKVVNGQVHLLKVMS